MSTTLTAAKGGTGIVVVNGDGGTVREFQVAAISIDDYAVLGSHLQRMAEAKQRQSRREFLADIEQSGMSAQGKQLAIGELIRTRDDPPSDDAVNSQRYTPAGVAVELWYLARAASPTLKLEDVKAIVTEANYVNVRRQITETLAGGIIQDDTKSAAG